MKRIAIFCDGTWNRHDADHPTNVVQLAQNVKLLASDGTVQQVIYQLGVGSGEGSSKIVRTVDKIAGGAFGWGLEQNIAAIYRNLVFNYEPGDEIYIFGFSRGAFTARSLIGLIRSGGIPQRSKPKHMALAIARYQSGSEKNHPRTEESMAYRMRFSPKVATSEWEVAWRHRKGDTDCQMIKLVYTGVWDTVGALGIPSIFPAAPFINKRHQFHDTALSSSVQSARHALALDERRLTFRPALWENLPDLNRDAAEPSAAPKPEWRRNRPYRQEWFPGDHACVGGGWENRDLSSETLRWVAKGAELAGLELNDGFIDAQRAKRIVRGPVLKGNVGMGASMLRLISGDRAGPDTDLDVSNYAKARVLCDPGYLPGSLRRVWRKIVDTLNGVLLDDLLPPPKAAIEDQQRDVA